MYVIYLIFGELSNLGHGTYVNDGKTESASFCGQKSRFSIQGLYDRAIREDLHALL